MLAVLPQDSPWPWPQSRRVVPGCVRTNQPSDLSDRPGECRPHRPSHTPPHRLGPPPPVLVLPLPPPLSWVPLPSCLVCPYNAVIQLNRSSRAHINSIYISIISTTPNWGWYLIKYIIWSDQQFYMSIENQNIEENHSADESDSKLSIHRTQRIKKSPKPNKKPHDPISFDKKQSIFSSLRLTPQFGLFQNELQKQLRLQKFWRQEIDTYYKKNIQQNQQELLQSILEEEVPTLAQVIQKHNEVLPPGKAPFEELYRYVELIRQLRIRSHSLILVESHEKHYLAVFQGTELTKMIEVSLEEAYMVTRRQTFMAELREKQNEYNKRKGTNEKLSEIGMEIAFLLFLMKQNKVRIDQQVKKIYEKVISQPQGQICQPQSVQDQYIACLIRKNIKNALVNFEIDYLNYFANLDTIEQYGSIEPEQTRSITDKKEFEQFIKRKKSKKTRKNTRGVLKTACAGCLSPYHEQYNPFLYCSECNIRFHKYCYSATVEGLCQPCSLKKSPVNKTRAIECQLCQSRGMLSLPTRLMRQGISIHIFCMLINGLWKVENGTLEFKSSNFVARDLHNDLCCLCGSTVYTYACKSCSNRAHPLCAYLGGWNMWLDENESVMLQCCTVGLDREKQSYRRKFMLNYRKMLFKTERDR